MDMELRLNETDRTMQLESKATIHFETLGCRLNQDETEGAARSFADNGFVIDLEQLTAQSPEQNDTILGVVNTCTVTGKAEQKARRTIRLLLEKCPRAIVIVTGCYAEVDSNSITALCPERIAVLPGTKKFLLAQIAKDMRLLAENGGDCIAIQKVNDYIAEKCAAAGTAAKSQILGKNSNDAQQCKLDAFTLYTPVFEKHSRASIKVEDGCNNSCTFCRIHIARGKAVSLDVDEVLSRVQQLERSGMHEVVFTGVNMSQYAGKTHDGHSASFAELLATLIQKTERISFRVASYYPQCITEELCAVLRSERVQPSFHLSIQSGSDAILKKMNRPYSRQTVLDAIARLRTAKENPFIACDIIAGFPGESEQDFEQTKKLCDEAHFAWIHAFPFSPRPGTPAFTMTPKIPERIKDERVAWLTEKAVQGKTAYISSFSGKSLAAIVENSRSQRANKTGDCLIHAVTSNFIHVQCSSLQPVEQGTLIYVRIENPLVQNIKSGLEIEAEGSLIDKEA